jgi:hypothetical protein
VPELCRFEGIIIRMFYERESRHLSHFHAGYGSYEASFGIEPLELIAGSLPMRQRRLVEAWAELHAEELKSNWERAIVGKSTSHIDPLR